MKLPRLLWETHSTQLTYYAILDNQLIKFSKRLSPDYT